MISSVVFVLSLFTAFRFGLMEPAGNENSTIVIVSIFFAFASRLTPEGK